MPIIHKNLLSTSQVSTHARMELPKTINGKNQWKNKWKKSTEKSKTKGKFNGKINGKGNLSGAAFEDLNPRKLNTNLN